MQAKPASGSTCRKRARSGAVSVSRLPGRSAWGTLSPGRDLVRRKAMNGAGFQRPGGGAFT